MQEHPSVKLFSILAVTCLVILITVLSISVFLAGMKVQEEIDEYNTLKRISILKTEFDAERDRERLCYLRDMRIVFCSDLDKYPAELR